MPSASKMQKSTCTYIKSACKVVHTFMKSACTITKSATSITIVRLLLQNSRHIGNFATNSAV